MSPILAAKNASYEVYRKLRNTIIIIANLNGRSPKVSFTIPLSSLI